MQFGLFFPMQMPRPWSARTEYELYQHALDQAELGDRIGIDYCWAQEHHFLEEYSHSTAPEVFLGAVSQRTKRMRLGHGVALMPPTYNHPVRVAERIAALDLVSGGRVEWGTGESSSRVELEGFGVNFVEKRAMWAEAVEQAALMMCTTPYPGYRGKYFSMPCRNIVPKPMQRPHPPLWVACTSRDTLKFAARLGIGALTFAFMDAGEAKFWVEEYYDIFTKEVKPIGQAVNPNVAMLGGLMCHRDADLAKHRGLEGQEFFKWALAHYYRFGLHRPGRTDLWTTFKAAMREPMAGMIGVGGIEEVREGFEQLEETGLDQIILLHQAAQYEHDQIMVSLELMGDEILPPFRDRHVEQQKKKAERLQPYIEAALEHVKTPPDVNDVPVVESYQRLWEQEGIDSTSFTPRQSFEASAVWKMHVGGVRDTKKCPSRS